MWKSTPKVQSNCHFNALCFLFIDSVNAQNCVNTLLDVCFIIRNLCLCYNEWLIWHKLWLDCLAKAKTAVKKTLHTGDTPGLDVTDTKKNQSTYKIC